MTLKTEPTELSKLISSAFPGKSFRNDFRKRAGKLFKSGGAEAVVAYLTGKEEEAPDNFNPPAKANIVAKSRPFDQWPISKVSRDVQEYVYNLSKEDLGKVVLCSTKGDRDDFFWTSGLNDHGFTSAQGLNHIFNHAKATYEGVIKKVDNRNNKTVKRLKGVNESRALDGLGDVVEDLEVAFDELGYLIDPPGVNGNIYCFQQVSPKIFNPNLPKGVLLPKEYSGCTFDPNKVLTAGVENRLAIPEGWPGHIPGHQRPENQINGFSRSGTVNPKKKGRIKKYFKENTNNTHIKSPNSSRKCLVRRPFDNGPSKASGAILAVIHIGEDWAVLDLRGLLRNAQWRGLVPEEGINPNQLLGLFTGDPVIDPEREVVTFTYKLGTVHVHSEKAVGTKKSKQLLERLTQKEPVALVSIDLGQTHPVAARISRLSQNDGTLKADCVSSTFLPKELLREVSNYRVAHDKLEASLSAIAEAKLEATHQEEIRKVREISAEAIKARVCEEFGIAPNSVPWESMNSTSAHISNEFLRIGGDPSKVTFEIKRKGSKKVVEALRRDLGISKLDEIRPKLSKDTRKALNEAIWEEKRSTPEYNRLSKRKQELTRRAVNYVLREALDRTNSQDVVLVLEDLNSNFFHGSGKRVNGWDQFFIPKQENRWFIQALHKSFTEVGMHRGVPVIEVNPARTSITCPNCGHCDKGNRDGVDFCCLHCGARYHADLEVATINIERVACTGKPMPKPLREVWW